MGETIISPWVFYLADLSGSLSFWFLFIGVAALLITLSWFALTFNDPDFEQYHLFAKRIMAVSLLAILVGAALPSKEACYQMLIANYATYENVEAAGGQATEIVDYIFEKFDEAQTGSDE